MTEFKKNVLNLTVDNSWIIL